MSTQVLSRRSAIKLGVGVVAVVCHPTAFAKGTFFEAASCERLADGKLRVRWTTQPAGAPVDVSISPTPAALPATMLSKGNATGVFEGPVNVSGRPYFHLAAGRAKQTVAERVLPLEGGRNFRDLGGYQTDDGRSIRWGALYRSGTMTNLTQRDSEYLNSLGIRVVCDLRTVEERQKQPEAWHGSFNPKYVAFDYEMNSKLWPTVQTPGITAEQVRATMKEVYATMPYELTTHYRAMFMELAAGRTPLAFHCSAGKDRTGIASGLVLTALGIPRATILDDYALSDKIVNYEAAVMSDAAKTPGPNDFIARLPKEVRAPLLQSDPAYLEATFSEMERREGSVLGFIRERLKVDDVSLVSIRKHLLERV